MKSKELDQALICVTELDKCLDALDSVSAHIQELEGRLADSEAYSCALSDTLIRSTQDHVVALEKRRIDQDLALHIVLLTLFSKAGGRHAARSGRWHEVLSTTDLGHSYWATISPDSIE